MGEVEGDEVIVEDLAADEKQDEHGLVGKKLSWNRLRRFDSFDIESRRIPGHHGHSSKVFNHFLILPFGSNSSSLIRVQDFIYLYLHVPVSIFSFYYYY